MTGAWSDGCSHLRGTLSMVQALQRIRMEKTDFRDKNKLVHIAVLDF